MKFVGFGPGLLGIGVIAGFLAAGSHDQALAAVRRGMVLQAVSAARPPADAGGLEDPIWQTGLVADGLYDFTTRNAAELTTSAYILYDADHMYVGFVNRQGGVPIVDTQATDNVGSGLDDSDTVMIDTSGSGSRSYSFSCTPRGVRYQTSSESSRFDPNWSCKSVRHAGDWTSELVIPFSALRSQRGQQAWRMNVARHVASRNEDLTWAFDGAAQSYSDPAYWPTLANVVTNAKGLKPAPRLAAYLLSSSGSDRRVFEQTSGAFAPMSPRVAGIDAVVPVTNTLAFVGTLNPDFSNLEVDQTTIAPQEYRRQYLEYRPFFAQGANYLDPLPSVSINGIRETAFYSPSISTFDQGYKLEGTAGLSSVGALAVVAPGQHDAAFGYQIDNPAKTLSMYFQNVSAHHANGTDVVNGLGFEQRNQASGESLIMEVNQERGTFVSNPSHANRLLVGGGIATSTVTALVFYKAIGDQYAPIDGYTSLSDIRGPEALVAYNVVGKPGAFVKSASISASGDRYLDGSGAVHETTASVGSSVTLSNLLSLTLASTTSSLRTYDYYAATPYQNGVTHRFDQAAVLLGYRDGTPSPVDASYSFGPYAVACPGVAPQPTFCTSVGEFVPAFVQQVSLSTARPVGRHIALGLEFDGTRERPLAGGGDSQWLRTLSLSDSLDSQTSVSLAIRSISGTGGYGSPGVNVALAAHRRFRNQNEFSLEFGTPATYRTLNRFLMKYTLHLGGGAGT